jgi:hypothetical protein
MADSYTQATVYPEIPVSLITDEEREILERAGFTLFECSEGWYVTVEEGFWAEIEETVPYGEENNTQYDSVYDIFQAVISRTFDSEEEEDINEFIIQGAFTCSKLRPGEFGGFVVRITANEVQEGGTAQLLDMMREGIW